MYILGAGVAQNDAAFLSDAFPRSFRLVGFEGGRSHACRTEEGGGVMRTAELAGEAADVRGVEEEVSGHAEASFVCFDSLKVRWCTSVEGEGDERKGREYAGRNLLALRMGGPAVGL